jgi:protein gp37
MPDGSVAICYAEAVAERLATSAYPHGFAHHYWRPETLQEPLKVKRPAKIFLDSMSDLMGHWIPDEQVQAVLDICRQASWHVFQLLTKNAPRLLQFDFPPNVWIGVSAPPTWLMGKRLSRAQQVRMIERQLAILAQVRAPVRWMSIEPLSFDIAPHLTDAPLEWAVIGAATNGRQTYQPERAWVENLLALFDAQGVKVFFKGNLAWDAESWREDFPCSEQARRKVS